MPNSELTKTDLRILLYFPKIIIRRYLSKHFSYLGINPNTELVNACLEIRNNLLQKINTKKLTISELHANLNNTITIDYPTQLLNFLESDNMKKILSAAKNSNLKQVVPEAIAKIDAQPSQSNLSFSQKILKNTQSIWKSIFILSAKTNWGFSVFSKQLKLDNQKKNIIHNVAKNLDRNNINEAMKVFLKNPYIVDNFLIQLKNTNHINNILEAYNKLTIEDKSILGNKITEIFSTPNFQESSINKNFFENILNSEEFLKATCNFVGNYLETCVNLDLKKNTKKFISNIYNEQHIDINMLNKLEINTDLLTSDHRLKNTLSSIFHNNTKLSDKELTLLSKRVMLFSNFTDNKQKQILSEQQTNTINYNKIFQEQKDSKILNAIQSFISQILKQCLLLCFSVIQKISYHLSPKINSNKDITPSYRGSSQSNTHYHTK